MSSRRLALLSLPAVLAALATCAPSGATAPPPARVQLEITHAIRGCHQWGRGQQKFGAAYKAAVRRGGRVDVRESEQMIFDITQTGGPAMSFGDQIVPGQTRSWVFRRAGTYTVKLVNVEKSTDVGLQSLGEDNVLTLTVVVR